MIHDHNSKFNLNMWVVNTDVNNFVFLDRRLVTQLSKTLSQPEKIEHTKCKNTESKNNKTELEVVKHEN